MDPVIEAMERGAVLLLDEIDLASNKIMCLQPILEGSGIYVKKINKFVKPKIGFNVVATANTKVKVQMMVNSSVLMFLTRHFLKDFL